MHDDPVKISDVISKMAPNFDGALFRRLKELRAAWSKIVGTELAKQIFPAKLEQRSSSKELVLVVVSESSAWLSELAFYKEKLLANVVSETGSSDITEIRSFVGTLPRNRVASTQRSSEQVLEQGHNAGIKHSFGELEKAYADKLCANIKDEKLRRSVSLCLKALIERYGMPHGASGTSTTGGGRLKNG